MNKIVKDPRGENTYIVEDYRSASDVHITDFYEETRTSLESLINSKVPYEVVLPTSMSEDALTLKYNPTTDITTIELYVEHFCNDPEELLDDVLDFEFNDDNLTPEDCASACRQFEENGGVLSMVQGAELVNATLEDIIKTVNAMDDYMQNQINDVNYHKMVDIVRGFPVWKEENIE